MGARLAPHGRNPRTSGSELHDPPLPMETAPTGAVQHGGSLSAVPSVPGPPLGRRRRPPEPPPWPLGRAHGRRAGGVPVVEAASPGRGGPRRPHPRRRPASRHPPWPSLASPGRSSIVPVRGAEEKMIDTPACVLLFFRFMRTVSQPSRPASDLGPPAAGLAQRRHARVRCARGPVAARAFFFRRLVFLFLLDRFSNLRIF